MELKKHRTERKQNRGCDKGQVALKEKQTLSVHQL